MTKITRYTTADGPEAEYEPGSRGRVLRNLCGLTSKRRIDVAEYEALVAMQENSLRNIDSETRFTAALLCSLHKEWLGRLYVWAGQYRTVEVAKGGFRWPPAYLIPRHMAAFESGLLAECTPCRHAPLPPVAMQMAKVHAELLLIHPFRDGNGRLARWLVALMAVQAGYPLPAFRFTGKGSEEEGRQYLLAVQHGYGQDYRPLAAFFETAVRRRMESGA
jgi:cell filamentation protein